MSRDLATRPLDDGFIALGWREIGDLSDLPEDRDAFKNRFIEAYPNSKKGAVPVNAGTLFRFVWEMKVGDLVIFPSKLDRMIHIGEITGPYYHSNETSIVDDAPIQMRNVRWLSSCSRTNFSQSALYEIGSFITLIEVKSHREEFLSTLRGERSEVSHEDDISAEVVSGQVEENTEDYVIKRLKNELTPKQFEEFVAHLLQRMGYHTRVTQYSADGGIDIIAHRDELGFEPPVIKVQCKQIVTNIGRPDVQQLMGATELQEFGLFVTLGGYTREARDAERARPNLRLVDGTALTEMVFEYYDQFEPQWQTLIPLKRRYIPGSA